VKIRLTDGSGFIELRHLVEDVDRHGKVRVYYRRKGKEKIRLRAPLGTDEFLAQYRGVHGGTTQEPTKPDKPARMPAKPGSLRSLIQQYYGSAEFRGLEGSTQHARRLILDVLCEERLNTEDRSSPSMGTARYSLMEPKHVRKCRDRKADWPEAANGRVKALRQVFAWAIESGHAKSNPAKDVPYLKGSATGFHTWTMEEVRQYEARHPIGTKARLALALLLLTGQRRSDVIIFGKQHVREAKNISQNLQAVHQGRWLAFTQRKNRNRKPISLMIPLLPELEQVIAGSSCGDMTWLITQFGKPFTGPGFGNWFRVRCDQAGLPHCTAHGLRKAGATIAAERGASERQLMAIFGWQTSKQAVLYTRAAEQKVLAGGAMTLLSIDRK
jgi:integrase